MAYPPQIRTFLDSGVLIYAFNGEPRLREPALRILEDPNRVFLSSPFIRHEVLPKAIFNKRGAEAQFYRKYFRRAIMYGNLRSILQLAAKESTRTGVGAMDSLHLAAARLLRADEFITTEKPSRSIHKSALLRVAYLYQ